MENEEDKINKLPSEFRPIGAWGYFSYNILFSIPLVGFILLIVFSFDNSNINRRNYARSFFCSVVIALILLLVFGSSLAAVLTAIFVRQ